MAEESVCCGFQTTGVDSHKPTVPIVRKNVFCFSFSLHLRRLSCSSLRTCLQQETGWVTPSVCLTVGRGWAVALRKRLLGNFVAVIT